MPASACGRGISALSRAADSLIACSAEPTAPCPSRIEAVERLHEGAADFVGEVNPNPTPPLPPLGDNGGRLCGAT